MKSTFTVYRNIGTTDLGELIRRAVYEETPRLIFVLLTLEQKRPRFFVDKLFNEVTTKAASSFSKVKGQITVSPSSYFSNVRKSCPSSSELLTLSFLNGSTP